MFIAVTKISGPREQLDHMAETFRRSAPDLKRFDGFLGLELWRDEGSLQAVSRWESRADMQAYQRSELFRAHHGGGATADAAHSDSIQSREHGASHGAASASAHYDAEVLA